MGWESARSLLFAAGAVGLSAGTVFLFARLAPSLGLVDIPGGRKNHATSVPLVGGLAIFVTLLAAAWFMGIGLNSGYFLFALSLVIAVGCWDDVAEISPRLKF